MARPAERLRAARDALRAAAGQGRYARVAALDALIELAAASPDVGRACLRTALAHLEATDPTAIEIDRLRTLRDRVAPGLALGPRLGDGPWPAPSELELRARAALEGLVRGPLPPAGDPTLATALALTAVAHLVAARLDPARASIRALTEQSSLPFATWAVVALASERRVTKLASERLARRAALELRPPRFSLVPLAQRHGGATGRAIASAALRHREPGAHAALLAIAEAEALALRNAGRRPEAIALLESLPLR